MVTESGFTLKLSIDEAEALVAVLANVGGSPTESPRGDVESVLKALQSAGSRDYWSDGHPLKYLSGSMQFADYDEES
ncbi:hypothetical protein [Streptomyces ardesiacus]